MRSSVDCATRRSRRRLLPCLAVDDLAQSADLALVDVCIVQQIQDDGGRGPVEHAGDQIAQHAAADRLFTDARVVHVCAALLGALQILFAHHDIQDSENGGMGQITCGMSLSRGQRVAHLSTIQRPLPPNDLQDLQLQLRRILGGWTCHEHFSRYINMDTSKQFKVTPSVGVCQVRSSRRPHKFRHPAADEA